jgi:peptidoglycan hydrolase CwlO-like protein
VNFTEIQSQIHTERTMLMREFNEHETRIAQSQQRCADIRVRMAQLDGRESLVQEFLNEMYRAEIAAAQAAAPPDEEPHRSRSRRAAVESP